MTVISDASPLHYLILLGHAEILAAIFEHVLVPAAVMRELQHPDTPVLVRDWFRSKRTWISAYRHPVPSLLKLSRSLHPGETQAIQLAHHRQISMVLLDDFDARCEAERQGLKVAGTLRLLAEGSRAGLLSLPDAFERLKRTNFRASERLYASLLIEAETSR